MEDAEEHIEKQRPETVCWKKVELNEGISGRNFLGCLVHYFLLSFVFVSVDLLQPMLLKQNFTIEDDQTVIQNFKNSFVIGCDIIVKILVAPFFGYLTDRIGRKSVNLVGVIILTLAVAAMPFCTQFYQYVLVRVFYAHGTRHDM